jgi:Trk-type K+ transport system membrane component
MILIFIGGIGFPVLLESTEWLFTFFDKKKHRAFRFSLFSKLAITTFLGLFVIGAVLIFLFERNHLYAHKPLQDSILNAMFYSITTRNAGLEITPISKFQPNTLLILSMLMFIGCSPSSVGGGVRTTTTIIVLLYIISFIKGEENVNIFGRQIDQKDVRKSVVVMFLSLGFCFIAMLILMATQDFPMIDIVVEVTSAFGTTGLSMGITRHLDTVGKITIMLLMFVGRVGTLYILMLFVPRQTKDIGFTYPSEQIIIG